MKDGNTNIQVLNWDTANFRDGPKNSLTKSWSSYLFTSTKNVSRTCYEQEV